MHVYIYICINMCIYMYVYMYNLYIYIYVCTYCNNWNKKLAISVCRSDMFLCQIVKRKKHVTIFQHSILPTRSVGRCPPWEVWRVGLRMTMNHHPALRADFVFTGWISGWKNNFAHYGFIEFTQNFCRNLNKLARWLDGFPSDLMAL